MADEPLFVEVSATASEWTVVCGRAAALMMAAMLDERLDNACSGFTELHRDAMTVSVRSMSGDPQALAAVEAAGAILQMRGGAATH